MKLIPVAKEDNAFQPDFYFLIEEIPIPSMCPEYEPGPPEDCKFPEFWSVSVDVFMVDTYNKKVSLVGPKAMRNVYKYIVGRNDRMYFWRVMKYLEEWENEE